MAEFHEDEGERVRQKEGELRPYVEEAMERKETREADGELPSVEPYDRDLRKYY